MGSRFDEDFADSAVADLLYHNGQSVTHYPVGIIANGTPVTAIWTPEKSTEVVSHGRTVMQMGTLQVAATIDIDARDVWEIDDVKYSAGEWNDLPGGMKEAKLTTPKQETTKPNRSGSF